MSMACFDISDSLVVTRKTCRLVSTGFVSSLETQLSIECGGSDDTYSSSSRVLLESLRRFLEVFRVSTRGQIVWNNDRRGSANARLAYL